MTGISNASLDLLPWSHCTCEPCRLTVNKNWSRFRIRRSFKRQHESHSQHEWTRRSPLKGNLYVRHPRVCVRFLCVCLPKLYGCAVTLNRFLVALLFHYLIRKDLPPLHWFSTPSFCLSQIMHFRDIVHVLCKLLYSFVVSDSWRAVFPDKNFTPRTLRETLLLWNRKPHCFRLPRVNVLHPRPYPRHFSNFLF